MIRVLWCTILFVVPLRLQAQTSPCGIAAIQIESSKNGGTKSGEVFLAVPPEHVRRAVLRALPAFAAKVTKDQALHIEATIDRNANIDLRKNAVGTFVADIRPETNGGVSGSILHLEFVKAHSFGGNLGKDGYAKPFLDEASCIAKSIGQDDPGQNPRGLELQAGSGVRSVSIPENTPVKVLLVDPMYSRNLTRDSAGSAVQYEVADDVVVNGAIVIRRGALAKGHLLTAEKAKSFGRNAQLAFAIDSVTAVDGQELKVSSTGATQFGKATSKAEVAEAVIFGPLGGSIIKGSETFVRAATGFDLQVSGTQPIQTGR